MKPFFRAFAAQFFTVQGVVERIGEVGLAMDNPQVMGFKQFFEGFGYKVVEMARRVPGYPVLLVVFCIITFRVGQGNNEHSAGRKLLSCIVKGFVDGVNMLKGVPEHNAVKLATTFIRQ